MKEPGVTLDIDAPVNILPKGAPWQPIIDDVKAFLRAEHSPLGIRKEIRVCSSPHYPNRTIPLQVRRQPLEGTTEGFVIVGRYGEMRAGDTVQKALEKKLPKLAATEVDRRVLMLERDQPLLDPEVIRSELASRPASVPGLGADT